MNKAFFLLCVVLLSCLQVNAQKSVGVNNPTPNANAALDVNSSTGQGFLMPRYAAADTATNAILLGLGLTDKGMMIYDTVGSQILYWIGDRWKSIDGEGGNVALRYENRDGTPYPTTDEILIYEVKKCLQLIKY